MYIHDISRDTLTTETYPGDPETVVTPLRSIDEDDECNLSQISMCVHAGTHIDAPLHFCPDGKGITDLRLNTFYGKCTVITVKGVLTGEDMDKLLPYCRKRILFRGNGKTYLSHSAAIVLAQSRVVLVGTDAESIALRLMKLKHTLNSEERILPFSKISIFREWLTANMICVRFR